MNAVSTGRTTAPGPRASASLSLVAHVLLGVLAGGAAGLVLGLFAAIPLATVLADTRELAIGLCAVGAFAGGGLGWRTGAGRPAPPQVASAFTVKKSRPDSIPQRQGPPRFVASEPQLDGELPPMAEPRRDSMPYTSSPAQPELNALLGRGSEFDGKLSFEGTVRIDGTFSGEITTTDTLIVGESAKVQAEISCGTLIVHGEIIGNIRAKSGVELHTPARVRSDIHTASLMIKKGVLFAGQSKMEALEGNVVPIVRAASAD